MSRKTEWYICCVLVLGAIGSFFIVRGPAYADGLLHVYFLNIGQGDAILIQAPEGTQILIDGGPGSRVIQELAAVLPVTDRTIDVVVSTHTDADHLTGLVEVLKQYEVSQVLETGMLCVTAICGQWEQTASLEGAPQTFVDRGYRMSIGDDLVFEVLNPAEQVRGQKLSKTNNGGIVMRMSYKQQTVLFMSDVEKTVEDRILMDYHNVDIDFLKVAHHGSKTSTSQAFLDATSPIAAFIQVGARNSYGHPTSQVIERLDKIPGLRYYRNDINGRIELTLDGLQYAIKTEH
ncbi:MAG: MBL fold metallo-hydrolase [Patescibacteria group bacterium]